MLSLLDKRTSAALIVLWIVFASSSLGCQSARSLLASTGLPNQDGTPGGPSAPTPSGTPTAEAKIYIAGTSQNSSGVSVAGYWLDSVWHSLPSVSSSKDCQATGIQVQSGTVYVAGYCKDANNIRIPGFWKNGTWQGFTPLTYDVASPANSGMETADIEVKGSEVRLIASGLDHGTWISGYWNESGTWTLVGDASETTLLYSTLRDGNDVYFAGRRDFCPTTPCSFLAGYFKNGSWVTLTSFAHSDDGINKLIMLNGALYAGGNITNNNGSEAVLWKDGTPISLSLSGYNTEINTAATSGTHAYFCGKANNDMPGCWREDGSWSALPEYNPDGGLYTGLGGHITGVAMSASLQIMVGYAGKIVSGNLVRYPLMWKNGVLSLLPALSANQFSEADAVAVVPGG